MTAVWSQRAGDIAARRMVVDIGTTSLTGVRSAAVAGARRGFASHPIYQTTPLSASDCSKLGSDFQRVGFLYDRLSEGGDEVTDAYGVSWLFSDGFPAPFQHPLETADWKDVSRHPRPQSPSRIQLADASRPDLLTVLDPPCRDFSTPASRFVTHGSSWMTYRQLAHRVGASGLGGGNHRAKLPHGARRAAIEPDLIVYGDDLGFQGGMYLSDQDFRNFLFPRMQTLFARLRRMSSAAICMHSCGAVRSIVGDLASLDVEMLNLDFYAKNMIVADVRRELPSSVILHAPVNLASIGDAVREGNNATLALLATELAGSMPAIAAPIDNIISMEALEANFRGVAFVRALSAGDLVTLCDIGPVRSIIENARNAALAAEFPAIAREEFPIGFLETGKSKGNAPHARSLAVAAGTRLN
uniref:CmuC n=1 Tax=Aminobacter carboxidus TaxID=376165 RepID=Q5MBS2_9HYPH|nr:CmuC [Aminobacter lissarensis]